MDNGYVDDEFIVQTLGIDKQPRLEEWFVGPNDLLYGKVYNDSRFKDGEVIVTSRVVELDTKTGVAKTKNTNYILGKQAQ